MTTIHVLSNFLYRFTNSDNKLHLHFSHECLILLQPLRINLSNNFKMTQPSIADNGRFFWIPVALNWDAACFAAQTLRLYRTLLFKHTPIWRQPLASPLFTNWITVLVDHEIPASRAIQESTAVMSPRGLCGVVVAFLNMLSITPKSFLLVEPAGSWLVLSLQYLTTTNPKPLTFLSMRGHRLCPHTRFTPTLRSLRRRLSLFSYPGISAGLFDCFHPLWLSHHRVRMVHQHALHQIKWCWSYRVCIIQKEQFTAITDEELHLI